MRNGAMECVSLIDPESKEDVAKGLLAAGLVLVEPRKEKRFSKLMSEYVKAQDLAKANRVSELFLLAQEDRGFHISVIT